MPRKGEGKGPQTNGFAQRFQERWKKAKEPDRYVKCTSCGAEIPPTVKRCPICGTRVRAPPIPRKDKALDFDLIDDDISIGKVPELTTSRKDRKRAIDQEGVLPTELIARRKLSVMKDRMMEKKREGPAPDIFGLVFSEEDRKARVIALKKDEEALKAKLVAGMGAVVEKGSILEHLGDTLSSGVEALEDSKELDKKRMIQELDALDYEGQEIMARRVTDALREDNVFKAENALMDLRSKIRAERAKDSLLIYRAKDLDERIERVGPDRAKKEAQDGARRRVQEGLSSLPEDEHPELRALVLTALDKDMPLEAEERLLDLKIAVQDDNDQDDFRKERETRIESRMKRHIASHFFGLPDEEVRPPSEPEEVPELEPLHEEPFEALPELEPVEEVHELIPVEDEELPELEPVLEEVSDQLPDIIVTREEPPMLLAEEVFPEIEALADRDLETLPELTETIEVTQELEPIPELEPILEEEIISVQDLEALPGFTEEEEVEEDEDETVLDIEEDVRIRALEAELVGIEDTEEGPPVGPEEEAVPSEELTADQNEAVVQLQEAYEHYSKGEVKEALLLYDKSISKWPSFEAYWYKSNALMDLSMTRLALTSVDAALEIDPERLEGWLTKADALDKLEQYDEAYAAALKAQALSPGSHIVRTILERFKESLAEKISGPEEEVGAQVPEEDVLEMVEDEVEDEVLDMASLDEDLADIEELELRTRPRPDIRPLSEARGLVNGRGLTNGNGLTNGQGLMNGRGLVNGRSGLVNGNGLTNGRGLVNGKGKRGPPVRARPKTGLRAIAIVLVLVTSVMALPLIMYLTQEEPGMVIDGDFDDWSHVAKFHDMSGDHPSNLDVDMINYALAVDDSSLFMYVETSGAGRIMNGKGNGVDILRIFIDTDNTALSGYSINGLGADGMIEVYGWDNKVQSGSVFSFNGTRDLKDWNGWTREGGVVARTGDHRMEVKVAKQALGPFSRSGAQAHFVLADPTGSGDRGDAIISTKGGAIVMDIVEEGEKVLAVDGQDQALMRIRVTGMAKPVLVSSISLSSSGTLVAGIENVRLLLDNGNGIPGSEDSLLSMATPSGNVMELTLAEPLTVGPDRQVILYITVLLSADPQRYTTLGLELHRSGVVLDKGAVTVNGGSLSKRYIGAVPPEIRIDGAFLDWSDIPTNPEAIGEVERPGLDLHDYRAASDLASLFFYMEVGDGILEGAIIPAEEKQRPGPSPPVPGPGPTPGPQPPLPVRKGEDMAVILIDSDTDPSTGLKVQGFAIGAEFEVRISGKEGIILSSELFAYTGPGPDPWARIGRARAANDPYRLEASVDLTQLGLSKGSSFGIYFLTTDWSGYGDGADEQLLLSDPISITKDGDSYTSTDGGSSWSENGGAPRLEFVSITSDPGDTLYGLSNTGDIYISTDGGSKWTYAGDVGLGVNFTGIATDTSGDVYVVSDNGTVHSSTDGGSSWSKVGSAGDLNGTVGIAIDADDNIYIVTSEGEVHNSSDSGSSWSKAGDVGDYDDVVSLAIDSTGELFVLRSTGEIHNSSDSGSSWSKAGDAGDFDNGVGLAIDSEDNLYVLQGTGEVHNSSDTGDTWQYFQDLGSGSDFRSLTTNKDDGLVALERDGEVRGSGTDALAWTKVGDVPGNGHVDITSGVNSTLFSIDNKGEVHMSTDNGTTWTLKGDVGDARDFIGITIDDNGDLYAVGENGEVHRSTDDGATWSLMGDVGDMEDITDIEVDGNGNLYVIQENGTLYNSSDDGSNWSWLADTGALTAIDLAVDDDDNLWLVDEDGPVHLSSNGGSSWTEKGDPGADTAVGITVDTNGTVWVLDQNGNIYNSTDDGTNWDPQGDIGKDPFVGITSPPDGDLFVMRNNGETFKATPGVQGQLNGIIGDIGYVGVSYDYTTVGNGYILMVSGTGEVLISKDDGVTWNLTSDIGPGDDYRALTVDSSNDIYVLRDSGDIYRSSDNGTTWTRVGDAGNKDFKDITTNPSDDLFVMKENGEVHRSTDGGSTWTIMGDVGAGKNYVGLASNSSGTLYSLRDDGYIYSSTDNGTTWTYLTEISSHVFTSLVVDPLNNDTLYALTEDGTVYQSTDGGSSWSKKGDPGDGVYVDIAVVLVPEFQDLLIPVICIFLIYLLSRRRATQRHRRPRRPRT